MAKLPDPGEVDILVVGFACVDFSTLNMKKKSLLPDGDGAAAASTRGGGESAATFEAVRHYAEVYRPAVVLVENISTAPWDVIEREFSKINYSALYTKVDTRQYLLPQTRNRGYMICINHDPSTAFKGLKKAQAGKMATKWTELMAKEFKMPANVSAEMFLLEEDDPALQKALDTMMRVERAPISKVITDWTVCEGRHHRERKQHSIGNGVPYTNWTRGRLCLPSYGYQQWASLQTDRVKDCLDMIVLLHAIKGDDFEYKFHNLDLSQNIDRNLEPKVRGAMGCLTPSGIPFLSTRGGPLVGLEALALQGLPIDRMLLARESPGELKDLAGNAMSSTVIASALMAALMVATKAFPEQDPAKEEYKGSRRTGHVQRQEELAMKTAYVTHEAEQLKSWSELCDFANSTRIKCHCERRIGTELPQLMECGGCSSLVCSRCHGHPKHISPLIHCTLLRKESRDFRQFLGKYLPANLVLDIPLESFEHALANVSQSNPNLHVEIKNTLSSSLGQQLYFQSLKRSTYWTARYESPGQILKLVIGPSGAQWLFYIKPDPSESCDSSLRNYLNRPVARCVLQPTAHPLFDGRWEVRLPLRLKLPGNAIGKGELVPSWRSRLGLMEKGFRDERVWSSIELQCEVSGPLIDVLVGEYDLLPHCGTANGALHKKQEHSQDKVKRPATFLFLDPARVGDPEDDTFVVARDHSRLGLGEDREVLARIVKPHFTRRSKPKKSGGPKEPGNAEGAPEGDPEAKQIQAIYTQWRPDNLQNQPIEIVIDEAWQRCEATLRPANTIEECRVLSRAIEGVSFATAKGSSCHEIVTTVLFKGQVPWFGPNPNGRASHRPCSITEENQEGMVLSIAWLTKLLNPLLEGASKWMVVGEENGQQDLSCNVCVPTKPKLKWTLANKRRKNMKQRQIVPYEDPGEATVYEYLLKHLPSPFTIRLLPLKNGFDKRGILIGVNAQTLVHRAIAKLLATGNGPTKGTIKASWRVKTDYLASSFLKSDSFAIPNNDADQRRPFPSKEPSDQDKGPRLKLRPEQERSLHWMIRRDCGECPPFQEVVIEESLSKHLDWRIEARAVRDCTVRGGIIADEVGYGKTITTIALFLDTIEEAERSLKIHTPLIPAKATLVIVPSTLVTQWKEEILRFCADKTLLVIRQLNDIKTLTIGEILGADIVLASILVLDHTKTPEYTDRCAALAGLPSPPTLPTVHEFRAWDERAAEMITANIQCLKHMASPEAFLDTLNTRTRGFNEGNALYQMEPSKRHKGQAFVKHHDALNQEPLVKNYAVASLEVDEQPETTFMDFSEASDFEEGLFPVLSMFRFHRKVIDEQSYLGGHELVTVKRIESLKTWLLSGTPKIRDVADVQRLASLLGVCLGVADDSDHYTCEDNAKQIQDSRTFAEKYDAYRFTKSPEWHRHRQLCSQHFLNVFARRNKAEIRTIATQVEVKPVIMSGLHEVVYLELQSQLVSGNARFLRSEAEGDAATARSKLLMGLLSISQTSDDALLQAGFSLPTATEVSTRRRQHVASPVSSWEIVLEDRKADRTRLAAMLVEHLRIAKAYCESEKSTPKKANLVLDRCRGLFEDLDKDDHGDKEAMQLIKTLKLQINGEQANSVENIDVDDAEILSDDPEDEPGEPEGAQAADETSPEQPSERPNPRKSVDEITRLTKSLVASIRAIRFWTVARAVQRGSLHDLDQDLSLRLGSRCTHIMTASATIAINQQCGHFCCIECMALQIEEDRCSEHCNAATIATNYILDTDLRSGKPGQTVTSTTPKSDSIVTALKATPAHEQVLLFCQHKDISQALKAAISGAGLSCKYVKETDRGAAKAMETFQKTRYGRAGWFKILMLDPLNPMAAGHNLTNVTIVAFVSPLLTESKHESESAYTQAIGRAKRFGQRSTVKVWHYLTLNTHEVNVFEERQGKKVGKMIREDERQSLAGITEFASRPYSLRFRE